MNEQEPPGQSVQTADLIIKDIAWLITVDRERRIIRDAAIAVDGGKIVAVGKSAEIAKSYTGKKAIDGRNTVATPGFIDCHLHSSFQLSRGLADELEGYEDLHASAELRRDILRNLGPVVIEEARACAA